MGKVITVGKFIALFGQPLQLVVIRAVVMVAIDVEMTVFLVEFHFVEVADTGQQIVGAVDELATLRGTAPSATRSG